MYVTHKAHSECEWGVGIREAWPASLVRTFKTLKKKSTIIVTQIRKTEKPEICPNLINNCNLIYCRIGACNSSFMPGHLLSIFETVSGQSHVPCSAINLTLYMLESNKAFHPVDFVTNTHPVELDCGVQCGKCWSEPRRRKIICCQFTFLLEWSNPSLRCWVPALLHSIRWPQGGCHSCIL